MAFQGKMKAVTFSYDDGVTQDRRLIEILDRYQLKCTFNLNSELLGKENELLREGKVVSHNKIAPEDVAAVYANHEVAAHTLTHPFLPKMDEQEIIHQVQEDQKNLEKLTGKPVVGMAYPGGGINYDHRVAEIIRKHTAIQYARTTVSSYSFDLQDDLLEFKPTVYHHREWDQLFELGEKFLSMKADRPQIFYIWGHSYEFDIHDEWTRFEKFCAMISGQDDIFYGTNAQVLLNP